MAIVLGAGTGTNGINIGGLLGSSGQVIYSNNGIASWQNRPTGSTVFTNVTNITGTSTVTTVDVNLSTYAPSTSSFLISFVFNCSNSGSFLNLRFGTAAGYQTTGYQYNTTGFSTLSTSASAGRGAISQSSIVFVDSNDIGCLSSMVGCVRGYLIIHTPTISTTNSRPYFFGKYFILMNSVVVSGTTEFPVHGAEMQGWVNNTLAADRLRFYMSTGNITSYDVRVHRITNTL